MQPAYANAPAVAAAITAFPPPSPFPTPLAALLPSAESTLPRRWTTPLAVSTLIWVPFTRSSAKSEILVLEVSQLSLTIVLAACVVVCAFSSAAPAASGAATMSVVKIAAVIVVPYRIVRSSSRTGSTRPTHRRLVVVLSPGSLDASHYGFLLRSSAHLTAAPSDGPAAPKELEHDDHGGDHQQEMDQPAACVGSAHTKRPQHDDNHVDDRLDLRIHRHVVVEQPEQNSDHH